MATSDVSLPRTSISHPIFANFIELTPEGFKGRVGLTFCPGKHQPRSPTGAFWQRDLEMDLRRLQSQYHATTIVPLITPEEGIRYRVPNEKKKAEELGFHVHALTTLPDQHVPSNHEEFATFIFELLERWRRGDILIIHCIHGLGRTGLVAACIVALATGCTADEAITIVRTARPTALMNAEHQVDYVRRFVEKHGRSKTGR